MSRDVRRASLLLLSLVLQLPALAAPASDGVPGPAWSAAGSVSWYFLHDGESFGVGTASADRSPVHLEARYNYEALRTGSAFVGWNLEAGQTLKLGLTPLVGCMFGDAGGPVLGALVSLGWGPLSFSSQDEWAWDLRGGGGFFYAWTELDVRPWDWLRAGVVAQRTRVFHTAREVVFGPLLGVSFWKVELTAYWFQPGGIDPFFVASAGVSF